MSTYLKGFKIRLLPTEQQNQKLFQFAGAARFIWNELLEYCKSNYDTSKPFVTRNDLPNTKLIWQKLKILRSEKEWLQEVSLHTLNIIMRDLIDAYQRFFKKQYEHRKEIAQTKEYKKFHPVHKRRKDFKWSFPCDSDDVYFTYTKEGKLCVQLPKIGRVLVKTNFNVPASKKKVDVKGLLKNIRVKFINEKWLITFVLECESQVLERECSEKVIGIDVGLKILAAVTHCTYNDDVKIFKNINKRKRMRNLDKKLRRINQQLSHKHNVNNKKDPVNKWQRTKAIERVLRRRRKLYYHASNIRKNYIHHVTNEIIAQNPKAIVLEDYSLAFMIANHNLSKTTNEQLLYEFRRQLTYKCEWRGIQLILAPTNYASTQICSNCDAKQPMPLEKRIYKCSKCGMIMDRDINAARNLEKYGKEMLH